ncbi:gag-pol polyprotein [Moniliophthora roreri MCA 2997]|uniref:Gag-pol polyprotein n=1 Tax=Moniliophthora roreri (strain MCA 2997) TaxID=1381753 RepID=V2WKQ3_MONRO|nr:gag-pol polyprotein [Moniliophthora roreri MCA 2997]
MFPVVKKNGSIRLVINLEELNMVTIQDSSLPLNVNKFAEDFLEYAAYGLFDMFSGFDAQWVHEKPRPLQAFHSPAEA